MAIGLLLLEPEPEEPLEPQAASTADEAATARANAPHRRDRRAALMTFSLPGGRGRASL